METVRRTSISENSAYAPQAQTLRANRSATQWLFNPYSVADTTNWAVSTGVGKLSIGGLTKVVNTTVKETPNKTVKNASGGAAFSSTADFSGNYAENERFALNIANEIVNNFPRRIHRIAALEGIDDNKQVEMIQELLLGEEMAVARIEGVSEPVPVLPQMLEVLRNNMREIAKTNSPQKALLLTAGKQFETAISDNIKLAVEDLRTPQQDVATGKRAGFDVNAKRNFLALGRPIPELKLGTATQAEAAQPVNDRLASALEKFATLLGGETEIRNEPDSTQVRPGSPPEGFLTRTDGNQIIAETQATEVEMEFEKQPKIVETKPLTEKQVEKAEKAEEKKAAEAAEEEAKAAEVEETESSTQCAAVTAATGERCQNTAVEGSKYCHIPAHRKQEKK